MKLLMYRIYRNRSHDEVFRFIGLKLTLFVAPIQSIQTDFHRISILEIEISSIIYLLKVIGDIFSKINPV